MRQRQTISSQEDCGTICVCAYKKLLRKINRRRKQKQTEILIKAGREEGREGRDKPVITRNAVNEDKELWRAI